MTWRPDSDPWERKKREALAEEGLEHLRRFWTLAERYVETQNAVAGVIAAAGGIVPESDTEGGVGDSEGGWTPELAAFGRRHLRGLHRTFEAERDGVPLDERDHVRMDLLPPEVVEEFAGRFLSRTELQEKVEEAREFADTMETAAS